jgi:hypothetical protein
MARVTTADQPGTGVCWLTIRYGSLVSVVQTVLVYVAIPLGIYAVVALLTLRDRVAKAPRYRPGQSWDHPPVWWTANPAGVGPEHAGFAVDAAAPTATPRRTAKGGARGSW